MRRYTLTLDLRPEQAIIGGYITYRRVGRVEINQNILDAGVMDMQILEVDGRLMLIMDAEDSFSFERKAEWMPQTPTLPTETVGSAKRKRFLNDELRRAKSTS